MKDYLVKAYAYNKTVRIYAATTTNLVEKARDIHDLWPTSAAAFGRLLTVSVIMGAMYKGDQELTIRVEGDGPLEGMVSVANAYGAVKGYVGNPHVFLQYNSGKLNVGQAVGNGFIHVTKDLKVRDMFTSSSQIQTGEIGDDFAYYFTVSEQIPSAVGVGVLVDTDNVVKASGGFILQAMPGCKDETIATIEKTINDIKPISDLINEGYSPEQIIKLLANDNYDILEKKDVLYNCDCSKEKFQRGLITLGKEELRQLIDTEETIETSCHFCNSKYIFNNEEINELIKQLDNNKAPKN